MQTHSIVRFLVGLASLVIIITGLKAASGLLGPILLALFIVLFCNPIVRWLQRKGLPAWLANILVVLGVVVCGLLLILFLGISVGQLSTKLPEYQQLIAEQRAGVGAWLESMGIQSRDILSLEFFQPGSIIQLILGFLSALLSTLTNIGLMLFIFIYMLVGAPSFSSKLQRGLGLNSPMLTRFMTFSQSISVYLFIKGWLGLFTAIGQTLLLLLLGVDFALLWGVLSFLFNFIPNIGYIISIVPPVLIALLEFGLGKALVVFIGYAVINNFFDMVIAPRYLGKGLDLSTLVTFLAVIFWSWILGPVGAFLALPLTVMIKKLVLESFPDSRLLGVLIGSEEPEVTLESEINSDKNTPNQ